MWLVVLSSLSAELCEIKYVVWPLIKSIGPQVRTLNLTGTTPCLQRGNMCHGKSRRSLEIRQYYLSSCCHVLINVAFIKMKEGNTVYHYLKRQAAAAGDAVSPILLGYEVRLFIGSPSCSCHCIWWEKIYRQTLIHLWLLLIICPNDLSINWRPSR